MGTTINPKAFERLHISISDQQQLTKGYILPLTEGNSEKISKFSNVTDVKPIYANSGEFDPFIFPYSKTFKMES